MDRDHRLRSALLPLLLLAGCGWIDWTLECDAAYPTHCIKPPAPVLNCDDLVFADLEVLEPDPRGFDQDDDGIACER